MLVLRHLVCGNRFKLIIARLFVKLIIVSKDCKTWLALQVN